ncbi:hypothetical protein MESS4_610017 [Mesorhizobium sp. STM 4661]|nr:hypothetical protein MESS4_610017 [Mesorhizobium sp. STM 4661]
MLRIINAMMPCPSGGHSCRWLRKPVDGCDGRARKFCRSVIRQAPAAGHSYSVCHKKTMAPPIVNYSKPTIAQQAAGGVYSIRAGQRRD